MEIRDRVIVVTGAASGIGEALVERFAADGARAVVVADQSLDPLGRSLSTGRRQQGPLGQVATNPTFAF